MNIIRSVAQHEFVEISVVIVSDNYRYGNNIQQYIDSFSDYLITVPIHYQRRNNMELTPVIDISIFIEVLIYT